MKLEWLGPYRPLMEKIIKYANVYARTYTRPRSYGTAFQLTAAEIQTLEYILENEDKHQNMAEVASRLGVSPSAFSRNIKGMIEKGLLEKYHLATNRKSVIVRSSPLGRQVYEDYTRFVEEAFLNGMGKLLEDVPQEHIMKIAQVFDDLADSLIMSEEGQDELIRIE